MNLVVPSTQVTQMKYLHTFYLSVLTDCKSNFNIFYLKQSVWSETKFALLLSDKTAEWLCTLFISNRPLRSKLFSISLLQSPLFKNRSFLLKLLFFLGKYGVSYWKADFLKGVVVWQMVYELWHSSMLQLQLPGIRYAL